jgi:hypothetical protein
LARRRPIGSIDRHDQAMTLEPGEVVCLTVVGMQDKPPADGQ